MEELSDAIENLTPGQFVELIKDVRITAFTLDAWRGGYRVPDDVPYASGDRAVPHRSACCETRRYRLTPTPYRPLIVFFFGAGQHNYGNEMSFYRRNLSPVNAPRATACNTRVWSGELARERDHV